MRKKLVCLAVVCFCLLVMPCAVWAASTADANEPIDISKECSLTLNYVHDTTFFSGINVQIYRVADVSADFRYTLTDRFAATKLTVNGVSSTSEWDAIRSTLKSYIVSKDLSADFEKTTDSKGSVSFDTLTPGLYFVMPVRVDDGESYYSFDHALIALPGLDDDGLWKYDVTAGPKSQKETPTGNDKEYSVLKLWRDNGKQESRPTSVEVDIICNGKVVETIVLSAENNWSYSWIAKDNGDVWQVSEKNVPKGYVVTVEEYKTSFTIINTNPSVPDNPKTGDTSNIGLYVMLMCASGLLFVILGITAKRRSE